MKHYGKQHPSVSSDSYRDGRTIVFALLLCLGLPVAAQTDTGRFSRVLHRVDSVLSIRYNAADIDTNFIHRPRTKWTVKARFNVSGAAIEGNSDFGDVAITSHAKAAYKGTMSLAVTYMGISLGGALNPGAILGRYKDYELNINSYGKTMGFDVIYQRAKNFDGWVRYGDGPKIDTPRDLMAVRTVNVNGYYAFNHRRFSYPAAFAQSYIQRQSAGSFMLAASFQGQYIRTRADEQLGNKPARLHVVNLGIGAGYGYNLVLSHQWLVHLSTLPTFIVYGRNRMWIDDERQSMKYQFPEVIITARGAVVHSWSRYFLGATMVFNFTSIGDEDQMTVKNTKWRLRTFVGVRF